MSYGDQPGPRRFPGHARHLLIRRERPRQKRLLDAITWALWGETRLGKQSHDQLVRIGADEMSVVLDFQNGGETYRVRRQRSRKSSGNIWELQIEEPAAPGAPSPRKGASDTGRVITDLLRMSYETFLNSAYCARAAPTSSSAKARTSAKRSWPKFLTSPATTIWKRAPALKMRESADHATDENRAINQIDAELGSAADAGEKLAAAERQIAELSLQRDEIDQANEVLRRYPRPSQRRKSQALRDQRRK